MRERVRSGERAGGGRGRTVVRVVTAVVASHCLPHKLLCRGDDSGLVCAWVGRHSGGKKRRNCLLTSTLEAHGCSTPGHIADRRRETHAAPTR
jgi:hypothetical protein